jgi:hypothetical protein
MGAMKDLDLIVSGEVRNGMLALYDLLENEDVLGNL